MFVQRLRGLVNLHVAITTGVALLLLSAYATFVPYLRFVGLEREVNLTPYLLCVGVGMVISARYVQQFTGRFHRMTWANAAWLATRQITMVLLLVFGFMFAFKDRGMSRLFMGTYLAICWLTLIIINQGLPRFMSRLFFEQSHRVPTLFIGSLKSLDKLRNWLAAKEVLGLQAVGFLTMEGDEPAAGTEPPFLGGLPALADRIDGKGAMQVILLEIPRTNGEGKFIIETCQNKGCRLLIYSNLAEQLQHPLVTVNEEGHQFYTLQEEPLEDPLNRIVKRLFDIVISLPVVVLAVPILCLVVWIMQRFQAPGSLFHIQERTGYGNQRFRMLKFRSMFEAKRDAAAEGQQAKKGDARIYPFGRLLRRTSLDEFPQFVNVLLGHMSAVGPRPHLPVHDQLFAKQMNSYRTRFFVKPGITGLAQCSGFRGEITEPGLLQKRIECDLVYITTWSIWLDLQITAKTVKQMLFPPKSAY